MRVRQAITLTMFLVIYFACAPKITRPVIKSGTHDYFYDYTITIDPSRDSVFRVTLTIPEYDSPVNQFCFPVQIPGSYRTFKFGQFVTDLVIADKNGAEIEYEKTGDNIFQFENTMELKKITYAVLPTFKSPIDSIPPFSGTILNVYRCLISPYAVCGFFPDFINEPFRLKLEYPSGWETGTPLIIDSSGYIFAENYMELQDSPILLGNITDAAFTFNERNYFIYSYCPNTTIRARTLKRTIKSAVKDADNFIGGIPADNYTFIFNFFNEKNLPLGALEHNRSSSYGFPSASFSSNKRMIKVSTRHELFHLLTPLNLRGIEIDTFNFTCRNPVTHLWFYEGVANWATYKMQLIGNTMSYHDFLLMYKFELFNSDIHVDSLNFIDLSKNTLDLNHESFLSVYRRGLLFCTLLDLKIIVLTNGAYSLRELLLEMKSRYPKGRAFDGDSLFDIIASLSHPDIKDFLTNHLEKNEPLPVANLFEKIGMEYIKHETHPTVKSDFGFIIFPVKSSEKLFIYGAYEEARKFGFESGDTLISFNDEKITFNSMGRLFKSYLLEDPGQTYTMKVKRNNELKTIEAKTVRYYIRHTFKPKSYLDMETIKLRSVWLTK